MKDSPKSFRPETLYAKALEHTTYGGLEKIGPIARIEYERGVPVPVLYLNKATKERALKHLMRLRAWVEAQD
jgi:hypothetical protein